MKKATLLISITLSFFLITELLYSQKQNYPSKPKDGQTEMVDTRIDNMGYWTEMAEKGLVPVAPVKPYEPAVYTGSQIDAISVAKDDSPDVPVTELTNVTQSENSIFVNPADNEFLLNSNNSTSWNGSSAGTLYGANSFMSDDAGLNWYGSEQGAGGSNSGDPTTAINLDGSRMYVNFISNSGGQGIAYSTNNGANWSYVSAAPNPGSMADKNHMWIDNSPVSPHEGNLYIAWTAFGGSNNENIEIVKSTDGGLNWSPTPINISSAVNAGSHDQGVNLQTGPNGEIYACWSVYDSWPSDETAIGFAKSTDGGVTFEPASRIISNIRGIRTSETSKTMRVNSFPVMAADISGGQFNGNMYIVWSNIGVPGINTGNDIDVYIVRSENQGATWSTPVKVNQDPSGEGKEHY
ncbi:MAG: glycoside hydrolase, partial [Bacteroidales bacterium]|nr:glycoside hydrolase [Bacteroidales bacterium]